MPRILASVVVALVFTGSAHAQTPAPRAQTGTATDVTQNSATLNATVDPRGQATTFIFEYGRNKNQLRTHTTRADAGAATAAQKVSAPVMGLTPGVTYFFRVVAQSKGGTTRGEIRGLTTQRATAGVTLVAPPVVTYGRSATLTGVASGPNSHKARAELQQMAFPFTSPFAPLGSPTQTGTDGSYSFTAPVLLATTRFRVVVASKPEGVSPVVEIPVRVAVSMRLSDGTPKRGQRIRFSGSVRPPHPGASVSIQKKTASGRYVTVARTTLTRSDGVRSRYSRRVTVTRSARYRVRPVVRDGDHVSGASRSRFVTAH